MKMFSPPRPEKPATATLPSGDGPPTLRSLSPRWAALSDKLTELVAREEAIFAELLPLNEKVSKAGEYGTARVLPVVVIKGDGSDNGHRPAVLEKLSGLFTPPPPPAAPPLAGPGPLKSRALALGRELDDVREAIRLLHPELEAARYEGSVELCRVRTPEYRAIVDDFCNALIALGNATLAHERFANSMKGVAWSVIRPIQMTALGNPTETYSEFRQILNWVAEQGHFDLSKIPEAWRTRR